MVKKNLSTFRNKKAEGIFNQNDENSLLSPIFYRLVKKPLRRFFLTNQLTRTLVCRGAYLIKHPLSNRPPSGFIKQNTPRKKEVDNYWS